MGKIFLSGSILIKNFTRKNKKLFDSIELFNSHKASQLVMDIFNSIKNIKNKYGFKICTKHFTDKLITLHFRVGVDLYELFFDFEESFGFIQNKIDENIMYYGLKEDLLNYILEIIKHYPNQKNT